MTQRNLIIALLAGVLALGACAQETTDGTDTTDVPGTSPATSSTDAGAETTFAGGEIIAELQAEVDQLGSAIAESKAAEELSAAWDTLGAEISAAMASISDDGTIAREEIESEMEDFEQSLDDLEVEENVRTAWEALRSHLERLFS
jgi:gas vesicle protein